MNIQFQVLYGYKFLRALLEKNYNYNTNKFREIESLALDIGYDIEWILMINIYWVKESFAFIIYNYMKRKLGALNYL